jgi:hypothetical protein
MKIDKKGIEEIRNTIETPFSALAEQLSDKGVLDQQLAEIVTFVLGNLQKLGDKPWEIVD